MSDTERWRSEGAPPPLRPAPTRGNFPQRYRVSAAAGGSLLILVGAHQGRDAHFRRAQTLSHRGHRPLRLDESFLHIVTGVEDLHDAQDDTAARLFAALREPIAGHREVGLGGHGSVPGARR
ncbi:hypothetical protein MTF65_00455 [Streptomyces sp. APSN-46.1]|uniref:hypothetical protein n=1 Tax=Streptomyces sp. APSN-46.1 TaxID=2929049 RepID=UPI001FB4486E|nr:hypothetical protein [Streptomyces sp. APSN-46.1]MCJ1675854.1 hypothetical protein [Streptomyces sp. APSN-46.1]